MWSDIGQVRAHSAHVKQRAAASTYYVSAGHSEGFGSYLREIGRLPLLATDEERELGQRIKSAREAGRVDQDAVNALAERNLRLVVSVAKFYQGRGVALDDLIGEGNIGLIRAARKYDPEKAAFSTHAVWWIRQSCQRITANEAHTIRRPVYIGERLNKVKHALQRWVQEHGRQPSLDQLAKAAGLTLDKLVDLLLVPADPISLNAPTAEDDEREVGDTVPDPRAEAAYERTERAVDNTEAVSWALDFLTDRQRLVLVKRLALDGARRMSLEDVGKLPGLEVTRERVRQIEAAALKRLRIRFKAEDGRLVRRTPAEEREQEELERKLMAGRRGDVLPGAPSVAKMQRKSGPTRLANLIDLRPAVAS